MPSDAQVDFDLTPTIPRDAIVAFDLPSNVVDAQVVFFMSGGGQPAEAAVEFGMLEDPSAADLIVWVTGNA